MNVGGKHFRTIWLNEDGRSRTLFPYFFSPKDEPGLLGKLADVYGYDA